VGRQAPRHPAAPTGRQALDQRAVHCRGRAFAEQWHLRAAQACASVAAELAERSGISAYWAVAETQAMQHPLWSALPCLVQGDGGLGMRMAQVHTVLVERHGYGMLIGADSPQLSMVPLLRAHDWLQASEPRCVLGPAHDGGFWLFGGNRVVPEAVWQGVRYGSSDTGRDFQAAIAPHGECLPLDSLRDVDREDDLAPVLDSLCALPHPTMAQQALAEWLLT
jgi:uncharacterized protein